MGTFKVMIFSCLLGSILIGQPSYFVVDTTKLITKEASHQCFPQVVFDGENFITAWADARRNLSSSFSQRHDFIKNSIYASRVSSQGRVLDSLGVCVDEECVDSFFDEIDYATNSNNSLVVGMYTPGVDFYGIKAVRIGRDMRILDSVPITWSHALHPRVVFGGGYYFLVFAFSEHWCGQRISEEGVLVDSQPINLFDPPYPSDYNYQLTSDGNNYLLVFPDSIGLSGVVVNNEVQVTDTILILRWSKTDHETPGFSATFGDGYYFVAYCHYNAIYGIRVSTDGVVVDTVPILIDSLPEPSFLRCAYGEDIFLVTIEVNGNLYCKRVSVDGRVLDPNLIPINDIPSAAEPEVAFGDDNFIVVWQDYLLDDIDIRYTLITPEGLVINPSGLVLSTSTPTQEKPDIAFDGTNYLVVWTDYRNNYTQYADIYGVILSPEGRILDPGTFRISSCSSYQVEPKVCFGEENNFVVWEDFRSNRSWDVFGARVTFDGRVLDTMGIPIHSSTRDEMYSDVASDSENYLVVCRNMQTGQILGARVSLDGILIDTTPFVISSTLSGFPLAVEFNGENYLVVWRKEATRDYELWGAIVDRACRVSENFKISSEEENISSQPPSITTNGNDFYVALSAQFGKTSGTRVSGQGIVLDTPSVRLGYGRSTSLAFDGSNYVLLRKRGINLDYNKLNICLINQAGVPLDTNGIDMLETPDPVRINKIARGPFAQCLTVFGTYAPEPYNTQRIHGMFFNISDINELNNISFEPISFTISPTITKKSLTLQINLPKEEEIKIKIYDVSGRIANGTQYNLGKLSAGFHKFQFDLSALPNGVYFITSEPKEKIGKLVITR